MKRLICALAALLLLAGCGSKAPMPTPEVNTPPAATPIPETAPQPTSVPETPAPEDVPGDPALLDSFLECLFSAETWNTWYMIVPGSGPYPVTMYPDESGDALREIFRDIQWETETWADNYAREEQIGSIEISRNVVLRIEDSNDGLFLAYGSETATLWYDGDTVYFHAPDADAVIEALFQLTPTPELRYAETVIPWQDDRAAAARAYADAFCQRYLDSGFVADLRLERAAEKDVGGDLSEYLCVVMEYAFKPARPELRVWQGYTDWYTVDAAGWIHIRQEVHLYRTQDDLLRFNFSQIPYDE